MKWVLCCLFISSKSAELETIRELVLEVTQAETAELRLRIEQLEYQLNQTLTLIDERWLLHLFVEIAYSWRTLYFPQTTVVINLN